MSIFYSKRKIDNAFDFFFRKPSYETDNPYKGVDVALVFIDFKRICYDSSNYKWSLKECLRFISSIPFLSPKNFLIYLIELKDLYYSNRSLKGKVGIEKFIHRLETSKKFMQSKYDFGGIKLKENNVTLEFIVDLKQLHKHLNISQNDYVKFVFKNFKTGLTESTLRRYYYDEIK